jgi:hypothetical protein
MRDAAADKHIAGDHCVGRGAFAHDGEDPAAGPRGELDEDAILLLGDTASRKPPSLAQLGGVVSIALMMLPDDTVRPLFDWYFNGDTEVSAGTTSGWTFSVSGASADYVQPFWDAIKVTVIGRHLFDTTNGWDGKPAAGDELVVVTHRPLPDKWLADHPDAPFHTAESVETGSAVAKELAGDGLVCVTAGDLGGQASPPGWSTRSRWTSSRRRIIYWLPRGGTRRRGSELRRRLGGCRGRGGCRCRG